MSSLEQRLQVFRKLPLRAQLAFIAASGANPTIAKNQTYLEQLKRIHAECLAAASPEQQKAYQRAIDLLSS
ncbi:MAG: hypothetical protein SW833_02205 [Cyanobacteriota bacterium]|nr:hypothetical protein [Cyanobacteriota bacterium]